MTRLIADIGGTNARFALTDAAGMPSRERHLAVAAYAGPGEAARAYLAALPEPAEAIREAVIAVATPVDAETIRFTNSPWTFTRDQLRSELGVPQLAVINDFAAQATAIPHLGPSDSVAIGGGEPHPGWPVAVIGPGTGLGAAALVPGPDGPIVVASEAGHVSFAPQDEEEIELLRYLQSRHGHVSNERLISGPGILALARAHAAITATRLEAKSPEDVTRTARDGSCPVAVAALRRFSAILGAAAGDLALTFGAKGGVFVSGGLCLQLGPLFDHATFRRSFEAKGRLQRFLVDVPVHLVTTERIGLLGAAVHRFAS
ncbi:MAG: glucokinase [Geminicoccaceae bacterium]